MINSILSKTSFKRETVLWCALVKAFTEMEEVLSFLPWRLTEHLLPLRKFSKGEIKLTVSLNINFQIKLRDYPLSILRDYALSAYPTELERVIQNAYSYAQGKGISLLMCLCTLILSIFML